MATGIDAPEVKRVLERADAECLAFEEIYKGKLGGIAAAIPACRNALSIAYGEGAVWVACGDETVVRVDPATDQPSVPIRVGGLPRGIAAGEHAVWVTLN